MSQAAVARKMGTSQSWVARLESGASGPSARRVWCAGGSSGALPYRRHVMASSRGGAGTADALPVRPLADHLTGQRFDVCRPSA
ncbi:MAG: helix-turn-helix transcriptional regulator [Chloroflexi bacterium]|nr:MAG: helix-turn-helix transcriptional regulator [Chloroflexota bacterium]